MKLRTHLLYSIIIIILSIWFLLSVKDSNNSQDIVYQQDDTTFIYKDTGSYHVSYKPSIHISTVDTFWKTQDIDTNAILVDYYTRNFYIDTIVNTNELLIVNKNQVFRNKLDSTCTTYQNKRVTIQNIHRNITVNNSKELFITMDAGISMNKNRLAFGMMFKKDKMIYGADYDILQKMISIKVGYKIFSK